jgi:uncharacterized HAD superfamily protein
MLELLRREEQLGRRMIGLDFDDSMFNYIGAMLAYRNATRGSSYTENDFTTDAFHEVWGGTPEDTDAFLREFYQQPEFADLEVLPGVVEGLTVLKAKNDFSVITARSQNLEQMTMRGIDTHLPGLISGVYHTNHYSKEPGVIKMSKAEIGKKIGISLMVEDSRRHAIECCSEGIPGILINKSWNQGELPAGIIRVNDWSEVVDYISSLPEMTL